MRETPTSSGDSRRIVRGALVKKLWIEAVFASYIISSSVNENAVIGVATLANSWRTASPSPTA